MFIKFLYKGQIKLAPARMFFSGNSENSRHIFGAHFDELVYLDPKRGMSFFFGGTMPFLRYADIDLFINNLRKLLEIFEKKYSGGLLAAQARKSISIFETAKLCAKKVAEQAKREFDNVSKKIEKIGTDKWLEFERGYLRDMFTAFVKAKLPKNCSPQDEENYKYLKEVTLGYARYTGMKIEGVLQDNNNSSEEISTNDLTNMGVNSVQG